MCMCVCVRERVAEDVGCSWPNRIKAYFSCGFWFALAMSLIHQDKQYMKKCVAYSFQRGNVSLTLWGLLGHGEARADRKSKYTPTLCMCSCVLVLLPSMTDDILQAFPLRIFSSESRYVQPRFQKSWDAVQNVQTECDYSRNTEAPHLIENSTKTNQMLNLRNFIVFGKWYPHLELDASNTNA